jgi:hypothetical protein
MAGFAGGFAGRRALVLGLLVLCAGLALAGVAAIAGQPSAPRWLALATVALGIASVALLGGHVGMGELARQGFRIVHARHGLVFRADTDTGEPLLRGHIRSDTDLESLVGAQRTLSLQKFVVEPSSLSANATLAEWNYVSRIDLGGAGGETEPASPHAAISPSRAMQLRFDLGREAGRGERVALREELDFTADPAERASLVFQSPYAAERQDFDLVFEGVRPEAAEFRIERGPGIVESGPLAVEEAGEKRWRVRAAQRGGRAGDQLVLTWTWDAETLPAPLPIADRLLAMARRRQEEMAALLAAGADIWGEEAILAMDSVRHGESAEEHFIIRQARGREATIRGGAAPPAHEGESAEEHPIIKAARARQAALRDAESSDD